MLVSDDIFSIIETPPDVSYENKILLNEIKSMCSNKEREVIDLKMQGYKAKEICVIMGCKTSRVRQYVRSIKNKAREKIW